jgi:hypothetical protein
MLTESEYNNLKAVLQKSLRGQKIKDRKIKKIKVNSAMHWQPSMWVEVGKSCPHLEENGSSQMVLAIFESVSFMVCTPGHGGADTPPYFFARGDIRQSVYEDD